MAKSDGDELIHGDVDKREAVRPVVGVAGQPRGVGGARPVTRLMCAEAGSTSSSSTTAAATGDRLRGSSAPDSAESRSLDSHAMVLRLSSIGMSQLFWP